MMKNARISAKTGAMDKIMYKVFGKRIIDFLVALTGVLILSPIFLVLTLVGAVLMKGNPYFAQRRPGRKNKKTGEEKIFLLLKFRTMTNEKDSEGNLLSDEVRLNSYGRFLRSTSLDELPQLLNILVGDMSFIGPRPLLVKYLPLYSEEQRHRHDVRPGLTGYAQSHGRNSLTWPEKFALDTWYAKNVSLRVDISIFFRTVKIVLKRDGISSETSATMEEFKGNEE